MGVVEVPMVMDEAPMGEVEVPIGWDEAPMGQVDMGLQEDVEDSDNVIETMRSRDTSSTANVSAVVAPELLDIFNLDTSSNSLLLFDSTSTDDFDISSIPNNSSYQVSTSTSTSNETSSSSHMDEIVSCPMVSSQVQSSSVETIPPRIGQTQKCPTCSKIIPSNVFSIHESYCVPVIPTPVQESHPTEETTTNTLKTVPEFTIDDRIVQLNKFEVLMLTPQQVKEFNELFSNKDVLHNEPIFKSWLPLKMSTIPTESESIKRILSAHTYSNVPKKKKSRQQNLPTGKDRFDPTSPAWVEVHEEQENKKQNKAAPKPTKKKPPKKQAQFKTKAKKTVRI